MICCGSGSGSDFGKVLVPAPVPDADNFSTVFQQKIICTKSCLLYVRKQHFCQLSWPLLFFFDFIRLYVVFGSMSGSGTGTIMHSGSVSSKARSYRYGS
jgi:hypothetical protein